MSLIPPSRLIILDTDKHERSALAAGLARPGLHTETVSSMTELHHVALELVPALVVVVDRPPETDGLRVISEVGEHYPDTLRVLLSSNLIGGQLQGPGMDRVFLFDRVLDPRNLGAVVSEGLRLQRLEREQRELVQKLGGEYQRLARREKLLDMVVKERTKEIETAYVKLQAAHRQAMMGLAEAIEAKDPYTKGHCGRVAAYAVALARELRYPQEELEQLEFSAFLHDIGKIGVRDAVLCKPGPLDDEEWKHMRIHPEVGFTIASQIENLLPMMSCIRNHHERWDGTGYPDKLKGEAIPLEARIVAIADAFDAMATDRPYKRAMTLEQCKEAFQKGAAKQFDPQLITLWFEREIAQQFMY